MRATNDALAKTSQPLTVQEGWLARRLSSLRNRTADDNRGAVMAEYGLLIAVCALGALTALGLFHDELISFYVNATTQAANAVNEGT